MDLGSYAKPVYSSLHTPIYTHLSQHSFTSDLRGDLRILAEQTTHYFPEFGL